LPCPAYYDSILRKYSTIVFFSLPSRSRGMSLSAGLCLDHILSLSLSLGWPMRGSYSLALEACPCRLAHEARRGIGARTYFYLFATKCVRTKCVHGGLDLRALSGCARLSRDKLIGRSWPGPLHGHMHRSLFRVFMMWVISLSLALLLQRLKCFADVSDIQTTP
jgi:hypothetical protein